jgi:3-(3-hydroxy-phenyl)propionate hydroxylase
MPGEGTADEVDVVVVGCGPVGALTANLLGGYGIRTAVIEREVLPHRQQRAFSCDDEALRIVQMTGLVEGIKREMLPCHRLEYVSADGDVLAELTLSQIDFGLGYAPLHFFDQPALEDALRAGLERYPHVSLSFGSELSALSQDQDGITVRVRDTSTKEERQVRAKYVLGCDGARSVTRTLSGISLPGPAFGEPWLAVCGDAPKSAIRSDTTRFVCDWRRPAFVSPGALGTFRMEFMLQPEETPAEMERLDTIAGLIEPYVDPARFTVRRASVHSFHHAVAESFRAGRVLLLGDAAHQMPPFMGQGLSSGFRDAANLAWKLALVVHGDASPALLDTYEIERRPHVSATADASARLGRLFLARSPRLTRMRDVVLRSIRRVPRMRRILSGFPFKPLPAYEEGFVAKNRLRGVDGVLFPQPRVGIADEHDHFALDAVLGAQFAVIGPAVNRQTAEEPAWRDIDARFVRVLDKDAAPPDDEHDDLFDVVDLDGKLLDWFARHRIELAVIRPDRFVFGTGNADDAARLGQALTEALRMS